MHSFSGYLTACAAVLVATLVVAEPLDRRVVNDKIAKSGLDHDVIPVTSQRLDKRIINGQDAQPGSHPYIAALKINWRQFCKIFPTSEFCMKAGVRIPWNKFADEWSQVCGGTLIHKSWVLTAAHCVDMFMKNTSSFKTMKVVLGEHNLAQESCTEQVIGVKNITVHTGWNAKSVRNENDIALIELSTDASLSDKVQIANLSKNDSAFVNTECVVAGWGRLSAPHGPKPDVLQEVNMTIITNDACDNKWRPVYLSNETFELEYKDRIDEFGLETFYKIARPLYDDLFDCTFGSRVIRDDQVCILDRTDNPSQSDQSAVCHGDSGGPLVCGGRGGVLVGVTSYVAEPCLTHVPQVYTRVSSYIDFIEREAKIQV